MKGVTVTRFVIKRGEYDYWDGKYWNELFEARLWTSKPFWHLKEGEKIVMVSVTLQELPYEVE